MKTKRTVVAFVLVLLGAMEAESALAAGPHRGGYRGGHGHGGGHWHTRVGFYVGVPLGGFAYYGGYPYYYGGYPYYRPYYAPYYYPEYSYYSSPIVVQQQSPLYTEQNPQSAPPAQQSAPANYWYYCADSRTYYPYVKECPSAWQRVAPQPGG